MCIRDRRKSSGFLPRRSRVQVLLRAFLVIEVDVGSPRQAVTLVSSRRAGSIPVDHPNYMSGLPPDNRGGTHVRYASSAHLKYFVDTSSRQPRRPLVGIVQLARTAGLGPADGGSSPSSDTAVCSASASRTHRVSRLKARNVDPFDHEGINKRTKRFAVTAGAVLRFQPSTCRVQSFVAAPSPPRVLAPVAKLERLSLIHI